MLSSGIGRGEKTRKKNVLVVAAELLIPQLRLANKTDLSSFLLQHMALLLVAMSRPMEYYRYYTTFIRSIDHENNFFI